VERFPSAPFNLLLAGPEGIVLVIFDGERLRRRSIDPGLHGITHAELDDPADARVAAIVASVRATAEQEARGGLSAGEMLERAAVALRRHDGAGAPCRHGESFGTVSSSLIALDLDSGRASWRYAAGPPCRTPYVVVAALADSAT
jgi:hypothetical protein